jgi:hypothetical protein
VIAAVRDSLRFAFFGRILHITFLPLLRKIKTSRKFPAQAQDFLIPRQRGNFLVKAGPSVPGRRLKPAATFFMTKYLMEHPPSKADTWVRPYKKYHKILKRIPGTFHQEKNIGAMHLTQVPTIYSVFIAGVWGNYIEL